MRQEDERSGRGGARTCRTPDQLRLAPLRGLKLGWDAPRVSRGRCGQQVALPERDAELSYGSSFRLRLDAFSDELAARLGGKVDKSHDYGAPARIRVDPMHEPGVDFDEVGPELDEMVPIIPLDGLANTAGSVAYVGDFKRLVVLQRLMPNGKLLMAAEPPFGSTFSVDRITIRLTERMDMAVIPGL